jgi:hypothetical protein
MLDRDVADAHPRSTSHVHGYQQISMDDNEAPVALAPYVSDQPLAFYRLDGTPRPYDRRSRRVVLPRHRRRASHGRQPGHRRTCSTRAGPDEPAPSDEPALASATLAGAGAR